MAKAKKETDELAETDGEVGKALAEPEQPAGMPLLLSTGSTLLNLACSGTIDGGLPVGCIHLLVGDSGSGKTWLAHTLLAEAAINSKFDMHSLVYDDVENGSLMNVSRYWPALEPRLQPPKRDKNDDPLYSTYVEEFYDTLDDYCDKGDPFVYVLDSQDALTSEDEIKKAKQNKQARRKKKSDDGEGGEDKIKGSYGDGKPKKHSAGLRQIGARIRYTESMLVMLAQTRDNIGFGAQFNPKTRSGGNAMTFYSGFELWFKIREKIKKTVMGKAREQGTRSQIRVKKNRLVGKDRTITLDIFHSHGIDDVGSCIRWLVEEKIWKGNKEGTKVEATQFGFSGSVDKLAEKLEAENKVGKLRRLVRRKWDEIEKATAVTRKNRYAV